MKYLIAIFLILTVITMPKGIKSGKVNKINMPRTSLTKEGRLPPVEFRWSAPGVDFSKYTYKELVDLAKIRKQKIDRKQPGRGLPKVKRG